MRNKLAVLFLGFIGIALGQGITPGGGTGGGGLGPVTLTGTPAANSIIVATSPTSATWRASVSGVSVTFDTGAGTCNVISGTGSCTAASTGGYLNGPHVVITDNFGTTTITRNIGGTETSTGIEWGLGGSTASYTSITPATNSVNITFSGAAVGVLTDALPIMGATGLTGATGSSGAAGTNGTNGTNGAPGAGFPDYATYRPSFVASALNGTTNTSRWLGAGTTEPPVCASANIAAWPLAGTFLFPAIQTQATNAVTTGIGFKATFNPACLTNANPQAGPTGGPVVKAGAVAGPYIDTSVQDSYHVSAGSTPAIIVQKMGGAGAITLNSAFSGAFIADDNSSATVMAGADNAALQAGSTNYWGIGAWSTGSQTAEAKTSVPVTDSGTLRHFVYCTQGTANTNAVTVTLRVSGSSVGTPTITIPASTTNAVCIWDDSTSIAVTGGTDYLDLQIITGVTTQTTGGYWAVGFYPTTTGSAAPAPIWVNNAGTAFSATTYFTPGTSSSSATQASQEAVMTVPSCTATNLYVYNSAAGAAGSITVAIQDVTAGTSLSGTYSNAVAGIQLISSGTLSIAQGHAFDIQVAPGGVSTAPAGIGFSCH